MAKTVGKQFGMAKILQNETKLTVMELKKQKGPKETSASVKFQLFFSFYY